MKLTGYGDYEFVNDGYSCGLPPGWIPVVSVNPTILPRPGTYATLGIGVVGEMTIPGEFLYRGTAMTFEQAMMNLFKRLNPVDTTPRQLRGLRNDGTPVAIPAVLQISQIVQREDRNSVKVNFVAVQPYWVPLDVPAVAAQVFESDGLRQSTLLDVQGEFPASPTIRVMATAQRATPTATVGWRYRRRYTVTNTGSDPIQNYPYAIDIGLTSGLVSTGAALSSGNDLRVVYQGGEIARTLTDWNSGSFTTLVWIVIPYLAAGASIGYDVLYGNASAGAPPTLTAGVDLPAFDIATAGTNRSSNTKWVYLVDRTAGNAGKGGWYLSAGISQPTAKFSVPGAWNLSATLVGNDDRSQQSFSSYIASGTKYQARFEARRAKAGSIVVTEHNGADGVYLRNPVGISSVRCDLRWLNMAKGDTDTNPIGSVAILTRNQPGENLTDLYRNNSLQDPEATIAVATYTPAAAVKEVFFAVQPWPKDSIANLSVDPKARNDRYINAAWYTTLEVNVQSGILTTTLTAETAWTPATEAPLVWLKADAITGLAGGAAVATWTDSSGNGRNAAQATGAKQPTYQTNQINGLPAVRFDGTETMLISGLPATAQPYTIAFVAKDNSATGRFLSSSNLFFALADTGNDAQVSAGTLVTYANDLLLGTAWHLHVMHLNGASSVGSVDGTSATVNPGANATNTTLRIAASTDVPDTPIIADFLEILVFAGAKDAAWLSRLQGYLASRAGLQANLPAGHPYKSAAPVQDEVYELATSLRYGGGGEATGVPPYKTIRLGNERSASGVGTPRLTVPLNKQVLVFTDTRKVEQWDAGVAAKEATIPNAAYKALDVVLDGSGNTVEQQSADWMPLLPVVNPLTNPDFDANINGWTTSSLSGSVTDTKFRTAAIYVGATPGALAHTISGSSLGSGLRVLRELANDRLPVGTRESVYVGAEHYTDNPNLRPRLLVLFYDAALAALAASSVLDDDWTPPSTSFRRRLLAVPVPAGAVYWAPGFEIWTAAASQNGSVVMDVFAVNDTEISVIDVNTSGLTVGASWLNRYAY